MHFLDSIGGAPDKQEKPDLTDFHFELRSSVLTYHKQYIALAKQKKKKKLNIFHFHYSSWNTCLLKKIHQQGKLEVLKLEISTQAGLKALVHPWPVLT